jgi:hypothetical protein
MKLTQQESTETELWLFNYRFLKSVVLAKSMVMVQNFWSIWFQSDDGALLGFNFE